MLLDSSPRETSREAAKSETTTKPSSVDLQKESLKKQRDALRQQLGVKSQASTEALEFLAPITPMANGDCPSLELEEIDALVSEAAQKQAISPRIIRAVMKQESGFKPCAVSVKGAEGLMQLMPETADRFRVTDPFDPEQNVQAGAAFLKQLLQRYNGDLRLALIAYNAGATRADQQLDLSKYPAETQEYLASIFAMLGDSESGMPAAGKRANQPPVNNQP